MSVFVSRAGQGEQRLHGRNQGVAAHFPQTFRGLSKIEKGNQLGRMALTALTAHRISTVHQEQTGIHGRRLCAAAQGANVVANFVVTDADGKAFHGGHLGLAGHGFGGPRGFMSGKEIGYGEQ